MICSLLCLSNLNLAHGANPILGPNDVSILFPLPDSAKNNLLWKTTTLGGAGELLPSSVYRELPNIDLTQPETSSEELRVVALRADPCFATAGLGSPCQAQIRLVWQPLRTDVDGSLVAIDGALHSFYELAPPEFTELIRELHALSKGAPISLARHALDVHPILKQEKMKGPYSQKLLDIFKRYLGAKRLIRVTFMQLGGRDNLWVFGGFDFNQGVPQRIAIPRIEGVQQVYVNVALRKNYYEARMTPAPQGPDTVNLISGRSRLIEPKDEKQVIEEVLSIARIENPDRHNPNTLDCMACHVAQPARIWATKQYPWLMLESKMSEFEYKSDFPLKNTTPMPGQTNMLRAFGYDGKLPFISQRVINETADTLKQILK